MDSINKTNVDEDIHQIPSSKYPRIVINDITFNDGSTIPLNPNSIIVFTGANNSGKSQVLKDIEDSFDKATKKLSVVVTNLSYELRGEITQSFIDENYRVNQHGNLEPHGSHISTTKESLMYEWEREEPSDNIRQVLIKRISTEKRLTDSDNLIRNSFISLNHPIYKMMKNDSIAEKVSDYFRQAFGEGLVVNGSTLHSIPLHVGEAPNKEQFTIKESNRYYKIIESMPQLQNQGDGMRSFASILLDTFTSEHSVSLIDEPEAFLHPPQARIMGKMLGQNNPSNRQLVVSTHSEDCLQGILDSSNDNVTIIRINRQGNTNRMSILNNEEIEKLWTNPLLRYSNILSGLFHEMVVVCESDYDCLFYQAVMNAQFENKGEVAPDVLFTHCGGKSRAKDVVSALKAVDVPVVAICDFDLVDSSQDFKSLIEAFGKDWESIRLSGLKTVHDSFNAKKSAGVEMHSLIKSTGKACLDGDAPAAYAEVEAICREAGLFIVPCGEMECFDKTINKDKKNWVYHILEHYNLATEPKMDEARSFVKSILDFNQTNSGTS